MTFVEVNPRLGHLSKLNVTRLVKPWGMGLGTMLRVSGATLERRAAGMEEQHIQKKERYHPASYRETFSLLPTSETYSGEFLS